MSIEQALELSDGETSRSTPPRADQPRTQFSDFVLTQHLQAPSLRLCYVPDAVRVEVRHIPGFAEGWHWEHLFLTADMTAAETVEAIVEELGVRKVVVQGHKTARVEYVIQMIDSKQGARFTGCSATRNLPADPRACDSCDNFDRAYATSSASPQTLARTIVPLDPLHSFTGMAQKSRNGCERNPGSSRPENFRELNRVIGRIFEGADRDERRCRRLEKQSVRLGR